MGGEGGGGFRGLGFHGLGVQGCLGVWGVWRSVANIWVPLQVVKVMLAIFSIEYELYIHEGTRSIDMDCSFLR